MASLAQPLHGPHRAHRERGENDVLHAFFWRPPPVPSTAALAGRTPLGPTLLLPRVLFFSGPFFCWVRRLDRPPPFCPFLCFPSTSFFEFPLRRKWRSHWRNPYKPPLSSHTPLATPTELFFPRVGEPCWLSSPFPFPLTFSFCVAQEAGRC